MEHYESELRREQREVEEVPAEAFKGYGLEEDQIQAITFVMRKNPKEWVDFMMQFELGLEKPETTRARNSAITIAISYIVGGLISLSPYIFISHPPTALVVSVIVTLIALLVFGYVKGRFTGTSPWKSAVQTMIVGGLAAAAAFGLARWLQH